MQAFGAAVGNHDGSGVRPVLSPTGSRADQPRVDFQVVLRHALGRKALLEATAHLCPVEGQDAADPADGLLEAVHDVASCAVLHDLGNRAISEGKHRRTAGHGLDHREPERLRPIDWEQESPRIAQELTLLALINLADELDARLVEERCNLGLEVYLVDLVDFGRDFERKADGVGN